MEYKEDDFKCKSCGVDMTDHLGMQGTCKKLQVAIDALKFIATYGGKEIDETEVEGVLMSCTGSWCAEQARWTLEILK